MKVYIYVLKHPVTNEVRYVGLTRFPVKRLNNEINYPHSPHFKNWINLLKKEALKPVMEIVEESEEGLACAVEQRWIAKMREQGCKLLNYSDGGESGFKCSLEWRDAISAALKGKKRKPMSDQHKAKIGAANKGKLKPMNGVRLAALNVSRRGIPLSDETKAKLSEIGKEKMQGERLQKLMEGGRKFKRPSKWTEDQKAEIKFLIQQGYSLGAIAQSYGLSVGMVFCVKRGQVWSDVPTAISSSITPSSKTLSIRNEKGQYERAT